MDHLRHISLPPRDEPLVIPWPQERGIGFPSFLEPEEWRNFIYSFNLHPGIPLQIIAKYHRAQKLYYLAWIDFDLIKAGELIALIALEMALKQRYGTRPDLVEVILPHEERWPSEKQKTAARKRKADFHLLLNYMVQKDGVTNEALPSVKRFSSNVIDRLTGKAKPGIAEIRNSQAHGEPFDGMLQSGLIELVCDLIHYVYRDLIHDVELEHR